MHCRTLFASGILVLLSFCCISLSARTHRPGPPVRLCGKKLIQVLRVLCKHEYNGLDFNTAYQAAARNKPGIVEECCFQACSYNTLQAYCRRNDSSEEELVSPKFHASMNQIHTTLSPHHLSSFEIPGGLPSILGESSGEEAKQLDSLISDGGKSTEIAPGKPKPPAKTFRSLFHLLNYINSVAQHREHVKRRAAEVAA